MARVIGIVSGKGGVGKTTVALNLGAVLAQRFKKNVTVIDCNVTTSHLGLYLGMYYCPVTLNKVLRGEKNIEDALCEHFSGMKIIPASLSLADLERVDITLLKDNLTGLSDNDIVILDASPGLGREAVATLKACQEIIFVTTPFVPSVMDIVRTLEIVNELGIKPIGIVLNMVNREKYEMSISEVEQLTRLPVIASIPYDRSVNKSLASKMPVVSLDPKTGASRELFKLGATLIGETYTSDGTLTNFVDRLRSRFQRKKPDLQIPQI
jgi:septum site-determining protein MinD